MFALPVDAPANQECSQDACDDTKLSIIQCEVQDTLYKRDQFLSEERAWWAVLGSTKLSELEDIKLDLDEKLQAAEQDLLDCSEGAANNALCSDERWDTRYEELHGQAASNAHMLAECQGLKEEAKNMACKLTSSMKTEEELKASRYSFLAALAKSHAAAGMDEELARSRRALGKLAAARHACDVSQRAAAEGEAALQRVLHQRSSEAVPIKAADESGFAATPSIVQDPKAALWSSWCEKSNMRAKAWQKRAERAAQRCDEAEEKAKQSLNAVQAFMPIVDAMVTEVQNAKRDLDRVNWQQKIIGAAAFVVALLNMIQLSGGPVPLFILHDAPALICFAVGILVIGFVRVLMPALREHVHSSLKVPVKSSSLDNIAMAGRLKIEKL